MNCRTRNQNPFENQVPSVWIVQVIAPPAVVIHFFLSRTFIDLPYWLGFNLSNHHYTQKMKHTKITHMSIFMSSNGRHKPWIVMTVISYYYYYIGRTPLSNSLNPFCTNTPTRFGRIIRILTIYTGVTLRWLVLLYHPLSCHQTMKQNAGRKCHSLLVSLSVIYLKNIS